MPTIPIIFLEGKKEKTKGETLFPKKKREKPVMKPRSKYLLYREIKVEINQTKSLPFLKVLVQPIIFKRASLKERKSKTKQR